MGNRIHYLLAILFYGTVWSFSVIASPLIEGKTKRAPIGLMISTTLDNVIYKKGQPIRLKINLANNSNDSIYIPKFFEWGISASFSLELKDLNTGKEIECGFGDSIAPPPNSTDDFIKLNPDYIYGKIVNIDSITSRLTVDHKYSLNVRYHSPISKRIKMPFIFLASEDGEIIGKPIIFKIVK